MLSRPVRTSNLPVSQPQYLPNLSVTKCPDIHATLSFTVTEPLTVAPLSMQPPSATLSHPVTKGPFTYHPGSTKRTL